MASKLVLQMFKCFSPIIKVSYAYSTKIKKASSSYTQLEMAYDNGLLSGSNISVNLKNIRLQCSVVLTNSGHIQCSLSH